MKPAQPRELHWSWERSPEWRGQFERMRRARQRLLRSVGSGDLDEVFDLLLAFFINAYHLRDWLLRSGKVSQQALDTLFGANESLRFCADLANIAKHYDLTDPPRRQWQVSIAREYVGKGRGWFGDDAVLVALSQGQHFDLLALTAQCETQWVQFLSANGLTPLSAQPNQ